MATTHLPAVGELRYQGKAKKVYLTDDPTLSVIEYTDDATAFNGEKRDTISGKGQLNNAISATFMELLTDRGIPTHFVEKLDERRQLVKSVDIVPLEVVVRNIAAGSLAKRLGLEEGTQLARPVVELYYKRDDLGDPLLNRSHIDVMGIADLGLVDQMETLARKINDVLLRDLAGRRVTLVDFKLEFGVTPDGTLLLADEISPDTCRFWDADTGEKLDKDRFRRDMGGVEEAYAEMLRRLGGSA